MAQHHFEDLLILAKTYPTPSTKYRETSCVAAVNRAGELRRLFPIPYRFLEGHAQFSKWEWMRARVCSALRDNRPESHNIDSDSIARLGERVGTERRWETRRSLLHPHIVEGFNALEARRQSTGETLGVLKVSRVLQLDVTPLRDKDWTEAQLQNLEREGLFDSADARKRPPLRKLPFDFHYHYECETSSGKEVLRHKLTDWEVGSLYWNCVRYHGEHWESAFRDKLETQFARKDLMFIMGTMHRFPDQWLIVGLVYPPKLPPERTGQLGLELFG
jgi:hypothetical protein